MILRVAGIELEFLAKAAHLRVDAAVETCRRTTARQIEQLIAIEHTLRPLDQCNQQIVFAGAQRHRDAIIAQERACAGVQTPAVEMVTLGLLLGISLRRCFLAAAQDGFDPRDQLAAAERLREVIVGPHLQADDAVDLLALGGQHDDRDVRFRAKRRGRAKARPRPAA